MGIGMNLAAVNYFATEEPFIDRFKASSDWGATDAAGNKIADTLHFDASGMPILAPNVSALQVIVNVDPFESSPNNEYVLTYSGTAKVSITNGTIVSSTAGKIVFAIKSENDAGYSNVQLTFSKLNAADPLSDVHVVRTDQVDLFNAGEIFNPDFVAKVSQWDVVRFMDWEKTNDLEATSWGTRPTLDDRSWQQDGVPLEAMVKLANEAHVDMWYNVPTTADNDYVTHALTYIRDNLALGLKVHVEYSNEVWNTSFAAYNYAQTQANTLWATDANHNGTIDASEAVSHGANIYYGYRSAQIAAIAHNVFGITAGVRLVDVLAGQSGGSSLLNSYIAPGVAKAGVGSVASLFQDYAIAPYFGNELSGPGAGTTDHDIILGWARSGAAGLDAAFHELEFGGVLSKGGNLTGIDAQFASSQAAANAAGLNLVAYEGGISLIATRWATTEQSEIQDFFQRLLEDPRMGDLYTKMLDDFAAHGGTSFIAFNDAQKTGTSGIWGALDDIYDDGSPRYDALLAAQQASHNVPTGRADIIHSADGGGSINALGGNDNIYAGAGNDTLDGGDGDDIIHGLSGSMNSAGKLIETDVYLGGGGADTIYGGVGNDHIYGYEVAKSVGNVDGADLLYGGAGNDIVYGDAGADTIDGGDGNDSMYGGDGDDSLTGGAGNDYMAGDSGNDVMIGGAGSDVLHGIGGDDQLSGGDGNDTLYGDAGHDLVTGGAGNDTFSFSVGHSLFTISGSAAYVTDEVVDFTIGADKISVGFHLVELLQGSAATVAAAAAWATQTLQAHAGAADVAAVSVGSDTYLFYDDGGTGGTLDSAVKIDHIAATDLSLASFV